MTQPITNIGNHSAGKWQLLVEVLCFGIFAAVLSHCFDFSDAVAILLAMTVVYIVPRLAFARLSCWSRKGSWVLLIASMMVIGFAIGNLWDWSVGSGRSLVDPNLKSDDLGYYHWALHHYDGSCPEPSMTFRGLPVTILLLWKVLGVSVVWPIALNAMMTLLSIVIAGATAARVAGDKVKSSPGTIAMIAMIMTALLGFYISQGIRVQKEAGLYLGIGLMGYALARMARTQADRKMWRDILTFTIGALITAFYRSNMLYFITAGIIIMILNNRRQWRYGSTLLAISIAAFIIGFYCSSYTMLQQMNIATGSGRMSDVFAMRTPSQSPYRAIIGNYFTYPIWLRILMLPVTAGVQYIIPFPWLYDYQPAIDIWLPRVRIAWYVVGGMVLYYYLFIGWRKGRGIGSWGLLPAVCYLGVCYVVGGTVSRYILPFQPMFVVIATFVCCKLRDGLWRHSFRGWMVGYTLVLIAVLVLCYNMQLAYFDELDEFYHQYRVTHGL